MSRTLTSIDIYDREAAAFASRYESMPFEGVHRAVLDWLPATPVQVLDVGAGSGRDAAWFAAKGHRVVAVEPAAGMREQGKRLHPASSIVWIDDRLPALEHVERLELEWDLIWLSAVWMHLPPASRALAFARLAKSLSSGGRLIISLRHGPFEDDRVGYSVSADELMGLAQRQGLHCCALLSAGDVGQRAHVWWETVVLELPQADPSPG